MANALYPKWKEALLQASSDSALTGTVKVALIDTGTYTYSATHQYYSDLSGVVGTPVAISSGKTYTNGVFDGDNITFTAVTGSTAEAIVIYIDTGVPGTSRLVAYVDTGYTGLPVTPNGGDISITWDSGANKIFAL
jgi:hypothetical protein